MGDRSPTMSSLSIRSVFILIQSFSLTDTYRFGDVIPSDSPVAVHGVTYPYPSGEVPIATYVFNYRSRSTYLAPLCSGSSTLGTNANDEIF
jgi:hypothetical protein